MPASSTPDRLTREQYIELGRYVLDEVAGRLGLSHGISVVDLAHRWERTITWPFVLGRYPQMRLVATVDSNGSGVEFKLLRGDRNAPTDEVLVASWCLSQERQRPNLSLAGLRHIDVPGDNQPLEKYRRRSLDHELIRDLPDHEPEDLDLIEDMVQLVQLCGPSSLRSAPSGECVALAAALIAGLESHYGNLSWAVKARCDENGIVTHEFERTPAGHRLRVVIDLKGTDLYVSLIVGDNEEDGLVFGCSVCPGSDEERACFIRGDFTNPDGFRSGSFVPNASELIDDVTATIAHWREHPLPSESSATG